MREPEFWQEDDLHELIKHKHEESRGLEYKRGEALQRRDKERNEISKDVSAFANSIGGAIVYGMEESEQQPHYAACLSPIDPKHISKEWLEQIINSRIQPRISGLIINSTEIKGDTPRFVYVVVIPEGTTAHQASDKKYYKRFNFESIPMEDYEIRQTMNRASRPAYTVELQIRPVPNDASSLLQFYVVVQNQSDMVAHDVSAVLFAPRYRVMSPDAGSTDFKGVPYTRIPGVFLRGDSQLGAVPSAYPLTRHVISFPKEIQLSDESPTTLVVKLFDQFGISLTQTYKYEYSYFTLQDEVHAAKRSPSSSRIGNLE